MYKSNYIDLKINGRLFPSFIMANFKKYELEEFMDIIAGDDPCFPQKAKQITEGKEQTGEVQMKHALRKYQEFIGKYLDFKSPYRNILLYWEVGVGKTSAALNIYNVLYNYTSGWNVFIILKASLKGEWLKNIKQWLSKDDYEYRFKNIIFINYDSPFADRVFLDALKNVDNSKKSLYMIDEVHNFIRNVYSNVTSGSGKRAQVIYDYIIQDKKENPDTRVAIFSATPAVNNPFELALLFNLLRPGSFPKSELEFNKLFVTGTGYQTINPNTKNLFQRRIMGLVSVYTAKQPGLYATSLNHFVDIPMSDYQDDVYSYYEEIEAKLASAGKGKGEGSKTYKVYTRQACNFVFPAIDQKVNGESRPRPGKFRLTERDALKLSEKGELKDMNEKKMIHTSEYLKAINLFITKFTAYLDKKNEEDTNNKYTLYNDIEIFLKEYNGDFQKFNADHAKKSHLYLAMYISSPKFVNIIFNILKSIGPTVVYSNYVMMEGLELFKIYLNYFGFYNFMTDMKYKEGQVGYVEFHGGIKNGELRHDAKNEFNKSENKYGKLLKIMLISPAGSEGLSLSNVRQIHIMEPYWNEVRIIQIVGRGIRQRSHCELPIEERHVDVYRYKVTRKNKLKVSTDQYIEDLARTKDGLIQSFLTAVKEVAVDCELFKKQNSTTAHYKCFKFNEESLFDEHIGPAYKEDILDDIKMDNGSNSLKSISMKIKVMKIKGVVLNADGSYGKPLHYWYYAKTGIVYDYDLHYVFGKVALDSDGLVVKLDKDTYVIDYVVPIPVIGE
jgi:superfamily II DNA or RNA helicase